MEPGTAVLCLALVSRFRCITLFVWKQSCCSLALWRKRCWCNFRSNLHRFNSDSVNCYPLTLCVCVCVWKGEGKIQDMLICSIQPDQLGGGGRRALTTCSLNKTYRFSILSSLYCLQMLTWIFQCSSPETWFVYFVRWKSWWFVWKRSIIVRRHRLTAFVSAAWCIAVELSFAFHFWTRAYYKISNTEVEIWTSRCSSGIVGGGMPCVCDWLRQES